MGRKTRKPLRTKQDHLVRYGELVSAQYRMAEREIASRAICQHPDVDPATYRRASRAWRRQCDARYRLERAATRERDASWTAPDEITPKQARVARALPPVQIIR